jgi:hypothetical protein
MRQIYLFLLYDKQVPHSVLHDLRTRPLRSHLRLVRLDRLFIGRDGSGDCGQVGQEVKVEGRSVGESNVKGNAMQCDVNINPVVRVDSQTVHHQTYGGD